MKVQQYNPAGTVSTNPEQNRRLNEVDTGVAELGQSIQGAGQQAFDDAIKRQKEDNLDRAEDARVDYEKAWMEVMHGEDGYLSRSGKNAYDGKDSVLEAMKEQRKKITSNLNPDQARLFSEVAERVDLGNTRSVYTHAEQGRKAWSMGIQQSSIENAVENGALNFRDPKTVAESLATLRESTITLGEMEGVDPKVLQERLETSTSKYYSAVVGRAIEQDPVAGEQLLDKYGQYMEVGDLDQAKADLQGYKRDQESMELANTWMTAGLNTSQAREQAEGINDPDLRKQAMNEFKTRQSERKAEVGQGRLDLFNRHSSGIENGDVNYSQIPRKERDFMTHGQRQALQALEKQRISGSQVQEMPFDLRMKMDELIGKDKLGEAKKVLSENYHKMTKQDRKEYSDAVNKGIDDPGVKSLFSAKNTLSNITKQLDLDAEEQGGLQRELNEWYRKYQLLNDGRVPTDKEVEGAIDEMLVKKGEGWFFAFDGPEHYEFEAPKYGGEAPSYRLIQDRMVNDFINLYGREPDEDDLRLLHDIAREKGIINE